MTTTTEERVTSFCRLTKKDFDWEKKKEKKAIIPADLRVWRQEYKAWLNREQDTLIHPDDYNILSRLHPHWRDALLFQSKSQKRYDSPLLDIVNHHYIREELHAHKIPDVLIDIILSYSPRNEVMLRSSTQMAHACSDPFDSKAVAAKMQVKPSSYGYGKSVEEIEGMFKKARDDGTAMHLDIHQFLNGVSVDNKTKKFAYFRDFFAKHLRPETLFRTEWPVWSLERRKNKKWIMLAAAIDAVICPDPIGHPNQVIIIDWKGSRADIDWKNWKRMRAPWNHLFQNITETWALQVGGVGRYLLEKEYGLEVIGQVIGRFHEIRPTYDRIELEDRVKEINMMLDYLADQEEEEENNH